MCVLNFFLIFKIIFVSLPLPKEWCADADVSLDGEGDRGEGGAGQGHLRDGHQEGNEMNENVV